ncbi:MAG: LysR family transcriptional regulator, low CO2-responsive transcriptional regulator [Chthoniobacter sp.]|nr:LysR family transcriptional regulator, low CO2-responsive transcriptional regulator [Chthoniobacter sp.]
MKALERDIGCRVLRKAGKMVTLTEAGEALLVRAKKIVTEMQLARDELEHLGQWGRGHLRLGASTTACQHLIPAVLREFKESYPQCVITIQPGDGPATLDALRANQIDLAISLQPKHEPQFDFRPLFTDELQFIVSPLHPWVKGGKAIRAEIPRQNFILYDKTSFTFQMIDRYFAADHVALRSEIELGSMEAIKELVKAGLGVSILAPWIARNELAERSLVALPLGKRKLRRHWGIVHWKNRRLSLPEETFANLCKSVAETFVR